MTREQLPPWDPSTSDGCSIPDPLRPFFPNTPAVRACCVKHDQSYYFGGTEEDRLAADCQLVIDWLKTGDVTASQAQTAFEAIRLFGRPELRVDRVSWAFGGERFCYDPAPSRWEVGGYK